MKILLIVIFCLIFCIPLAAEDIVVVIDPDSPRTTSHFHIGATHTHGFWEYGNGQAVERAKNLLIDGVALQNQHIMGWGAGNPEPQPGTYEWSDLDHRVELMRSIDTPMIITFCQAPGWMKGEDDWAMEQEVLDEHVDDFAELCARVAERYKAVSYFQVWNELKGYWNSSLNNWDYERYTAMYNAVYDAVKAVRPEARIGGPYIVIQGDGAVEIGKSGRDTHVPVDSRDRTFLRYWLNNNVGADFICMDYGLIDYHDPNTYTHDEKMQLTRFWGKWVSDIREMTDLPIFISEFYGGADGDDPEFTAANHASCYYHALINGASVALQWNPEQGELQNYLFTDTQTANGGQPTPHYFVVKAINDYFSAGAEIVVSSSSSEWLEVLATADKTMLINKKDESVTAIVNGEPVQLERYQVKILDTPLGADVEDNQKLDQGSTIETRYGASGPLLYLTTPRSTTVTIQIFNLLGQKVRQFSRGLSAHSINVIPVFDQANVPARGRYLVRVQGLEKLLVQKILLK